MFSVGFSSVLFASFSLRAHFKPLPFSHRKTYTIQGDDLGSLGKSPPNPITDHPNELNQADRLEQLPAKAGLVPRAFNKLFNLLQPDDEFKVSVIEIYNEEVYDLLAESSEPLRIYECQKGVTLNNLKEFTIRHASDLNTILQMSDSRRQFASTLMNKRSSRSHVIYQYTHHRKETLPNNQVVEKVGKLNLVDLAGSECAKRTGCQDIRALEAGNINRSLLTLTRVIDALVKGQKYVPFRSSNLTRIIQDTLGGNSKTVLVATLSPALIDFEDTLSTLAFASTVKQVKNLASANVKVIQNNDYEEKLKELEENLLVEQSKHEEELARLRAETEQLKADYERRLKRNVDELEEFEHQLESKDEEIQGLKRNLTKLTNELIESTMNQNQKENVEQPQEPAIKKHKSTKPLSNAANKNNRVSFTDRKAEDLSKLLKNDVNFLSKEHNLITRKVNKLKSLITEQEATLKQRPEGEQEDQFCADRMDEDFCSFLHQMIHIALKDEFDLFYEYLSSEVQSKLSNEDAGELDEKFNEFKEYVDEKLELVTETANNTMNTHEKNCKLRFWRNFGGTSKDFGRHLRDFGRL